MRGICSKLIDFPHCSSVSIVDLEHLIAGWDWLLQSWPRIIPLRVHINVNKVLTLREKRPNTELFLVLIFPHLDWIREILRICIQSECGKIRTRNNSVFGHLWRSVMNPKLLPSIHFTTLLYLYTPWSNRLFSHLNADLHNPTISTALPSLWRIKTGAF